MMGFMERSAIKLLKKRGNSDGEIARALGRDRKTIRKALGEPADKEYQRRKQGSLVDPYEDQIIQWMQEGIPVTVMLERLRKDTQNPYKGGNSIFYQRVQRIRKEKKMAHQKAILCFGYRVARNGDLRDCLVNTFMWIGERDVSFHSLRFPGLPDTASWAD
jgi:transposase